MTSLERTTSQLLIHHVMKATQAQILTTKQVPRSQKWQAELWSTSREFKLERVRRLPQEILTDSRETETAPTAAKSIRRVLKICRLQVETQMVIIRAQVVSSMVRIHT